jgi:hypothetical protein
MAITKTVTVRLEVTEAPDFFPEVVPTVLTVDRGTVAKYLCSFVANSTFTGRVRLSASPIGIDASWSMTEIGVGDIAELSYETGPLPLADYDITITFEEI